ncbi:MAG: tetratricopeptide repeat protein [Pirellulaceae bacterium]
MNSNWISRQRSCISWFAVMLLGVLMHGSDLLAQPDANDKQQPAKKSSPKAVAAYADAANFQNQKLYDIAVEEWERFLGKFADDPLAGKAQQYLGVCHLQQKQYAKASIAFEAVLKKYPDFGNLEETYLNLAWCHYSQALVEKKDDARAKLFQQAATRFAEQVKHFPAGKLADQAFFFRGESLHSIAEKEQAATSFAALVKNFPKSRLRPDALYSLGVAREDLKQFAEAGKAYDLFLAEYQEHNLFTEVSMRKAETVLQTGDFQQAARRFGDVAAVEKFVSADYALYRQAFCLTKLDQLAAAGKIYVQLVESFPKSKFSTDAMLSAGRCFYRSQQFKDAQLWFEKLLETDGEAAYEASHWIARIHLGSNAPAAALELVEKMLPKAAQSRYYVNLKMDQADAFYELPEKRNAALAAYLAIAREHADSDLAPQALYNGAFVALDTRQYPAALEHAAAFQQKFPENALLPDVNYVIAESQLQLQKLDEAEKQYRELIEKFGKHREVRVWKLRLAVVLYAQRKYPETVTWIEQLVTQLKQPTAVAEAQFLLGASQFSQEKYPAAVPALQASLAADGSWRQADETLLFLSRAQQKLDQVAAATKTIQTLLKDFPRSRVLDQAHYRLGEYLYAAGDYGAAIERYQQVVSQWPKSAFVPYALYGQGWSQLKMKQFDPATKTFSTLVEKHAQHQLATPGLLARAMCHRQAKQYQATIDDVQVFLQRKPSLNDKLDGLYERGLAEVALKQQGAAVKSFEALLGEKAEFANTDTVLYELAWAYLGLKEGARSTDMFSRLVKEYPKSGFIADACFRLGESRYEQEQYDAAIQQYEKALQQKPAGELLENVLHKLGWAHYRDGKFELAHQRFTNQLKQLPEGRLVNDGTFMQAESLFKLKKYEEVFPVYEKLLKLELSSPQFQVLTRLHAGQAAGQLKRWQASLAILETIPKEFAESSYLPETHYEMGWAQHQLKKYEQALQSYEQAATESRTAVGARARFMMGEVEFEQKKFAAAIRHFQRVMYGFGGKAAPVNVKSWQSKSGLEAGRCCEVQAQGSKTKADRKKWITEAQKFYTYILQGHPQSGSAGLAKKRLEALSSLR